MSKQSLTQAPALIRRSPVLVEGDVLIALVKSLKLSYWEWGEMDHRFLFSTVLPPYQQIKIFQNTSVRAILLIVWILMSYPFSTLPLKSFQLSQSRFFNFKGNWRLDITSLSSEIVCNGRRWTLNQHEPNRLLLHNLYEVHETVYTGLRKFTFVAEKQLFYPKQQVVDLRSMFPTSITLS